MTKHLMTVFGVKERTARGYAVVVAALRYFYDRNEEFFLARSHTWTEFMEAINISLAEKILILLSGVSSRAMGQGCQACSC